MKRLLLVASALLAYGPTLAAETIPFPDVAGIDSKVAALAAGSSPLSLAAGCIAILSLEAATAEDTGRRDILAKEVSLLVGAVPKLGTAQGVDLGTARELVAYRMLPVGIVAARFAPISLPKTAADGVADPVGDCEAAATDTSRFGSWPSK